MSESTPVSIHPASATDELRCTVAETREISALLLELCRRAEQVSLHIDETEMYCASSVLAVDADSGSMVLDGSRMACAVKLHLGHGQPVHVHAQLDKVDIRFVLPGLRSSSHHGRDAFHAPLPQQVLHLQRRELYRLATPLSQWPICEVPVARSLHPLRVADIGSGGMALLHDLDPMHLDIGARIAGCRLQIPDGPLLLVDIRVCNDRLIERIDGHPLRRTGVAFDGLPGSAQNHISRYIFSIDRQRNARRQGID
jgi:c-di-GMP-binding flagellar brake protein YcgR